MCVFVYSEILQMNSQPHFTSVAFGIGDYQVACLIEEKRLKMTVTPLNPNKSSILNLSQFISSNQSISFWVSSKIQQDYESVPQKTEQTENQVVKNTFLSKKLDQLQRSYRSLENKIQIFNDQRNQLWNKKKNQVLTKLSTDQCSSPTENFNKIKAQLSSNKLGEIISEKDLEISLLQRKVNQRDQLVRELADGLMAANSQKEEIYNEYEQMLQTVVFQKKEQPIIVPIIVKEEIFVSQPLEQQPQNEKISQIEKTQLLVQKVGSTKNE